MHTDTVPDIPARAGKKEWIALAVLSLPAMLVIMDLTILHLAVPQLSVDLRPSSSQLLWITDVYGFLIAGFLITMGSLGDRIGRRRLLLIGATAFGGASVLAAYSTSPEMLIAARALLGVAGATLMPSTLSLIRTLFNDPRQRTTAIALWMMSFMVGSSVGPLVGGALLENFWWGSVFLVAVPVMVLLIVVGPHLLPEYRDSSATRLDFLSAVLLLGTVLPVIYGVKKIAEDGFAASLMAAILVGVAVGVAFVRRQRRLDDPLIDVSLFANPGYGASLGVMTICTFAMMGLNLFVMQYLQLVHGLSPFHAGLWVLPMTGGMMIGMMAAPVLARRIRPAFVIAGGMVAGTVGITLMAQVGGANGFAVLIAGTVVMAAGFAPAAALGTDLVISSAPPEKAGAASAASETSNEFGGALGLAVLGSVGAAVYRSHMTDDMSAQLPAGAGDVARETLAAATAVSERLPAMPGANLLETAKVAFTAGFQVTALISASVVAVGAVLATVLLRNVRQAASATSDDDGLRHGDRPNATHPQVMTQGVAS